MKTQLAGCVLLDDYGRMLLLHRSTEKSSQWELPGGKIEENELPEQAAVRELQEELGVEVRLTRALGVGEFEDGEREFAYTWFQAQIMGGEPQILEPETFDDFDYFDMEDLMGLALSANMTVLLAKIIDGSVALDS